MTVRGKIGQPFENAYGGQNIALTLSTTIDRTQYGLDWQMNLPSGDPVLGDEVKVDVELELVRAKTMSASRARSRCWALWGRFAATRTTPG